MTYSSGSPTPTPAPHPKLADSRWRYLNSWWVLLPPLSFGFLSWLGFLIAGARSGKWTLWASAALYAAMLAGATVLNSVDREGLGGNIAVTLLLGGCWLGASVHAMVANRGFLRALAARSTWYDGAAGAGPGAAGGWGGAGAGSGAGAGAGFLGVSQEEYFAPDGYPATPTVPPPAAPPVPSAAVAPGSSDRVDVNAATAEALSELPGVGTELAHRIVAARDSRGAFRDLDELVVVVGLQPHELVRLRDRLAFGQTRSASGDGRPTGRILDI